jgi:hypothetical protein
MIGCVIIQKIIYPIASLITYALKINYFKIHVGIEN